MAATDLNTLIDMGFDKRRAELAVRKPGGLHGALEWLEKNQEKSFEDVTAAEASEETDPNTQADALKPGEEAKSLICNDCGRKFRSQEQAEFHASKSSHVDFAESVEEIAPLTEEEKKAKLEELRRKLADKRAGGSEQDKLDKKRNEEIRRKSTKETADIKEDLRKKEQLKEAAARKREKQEEIAAKERIKQRIAADKEERRLKIEKEKARREGRAPPAAPKAAFAPTIPGVITSKPAAAYTETRLRLQTQLGSIQKSFPVETSLFEVAAAVRQESGVDVTRITQRYPWKVFYTIDFGATLKELGQGEQHKPAATSLNPYEEVKPHISEFTAQEIATLSSRLEKQLGPEYISSRPGAGGGKVHYLSADKCINLANEVFGFNGWSSGIQQVQIDFVDENQSTGKVSLGLSVIVRVTLRDGTFHEDIGYGHIENCKGKAPAFEKAKKEGTTDGLKRALRNFGNLLGNCVYDKEYVAKVTKLKIAPTKWDPDNLHRHPDFAPIKKESAHEGLSRQPSLPLMRKEWPAEIGQSEGAPPTGDPEDEFGSDDFDEVDFSVPQGGHPDEVALDPSLSSDRFRCRHSPANDRRPQIRNANQHHNPRVRSPLARHHASGPTSDFQTPVSAGIDSITRPMITSEDAIPTIQSARPLQPAHPEQDPVATEVQHFVEGFRPKTLVQLNNTPSLQLSNLYDHEPPVGFFTARAAESLQSGPISAIKAPAFNPHLESPSIRKTAGVDHSKTKPVGRDLVGALPAPALSRASFPNAHSDKIRKVGMPVGAVSPLQNRGSYKPPQLKRSAESNGARSALEDVTNALISVSADTTVGVKRQKGGMEAPTASANHGMLNM